ncbi:MAG: ATP-binding protein [Alphaproteobacteria bacterium]
MQIRILRTSGFQIALFYLLLLSVTLLALVSFVYWSTAQLIDRQTNETIEAEIRGLAEQYRDEGLAQLLTVIGERSGPRGNPLGVYLLANRRLEPLAGNLSAWPDIQPGESGWVEAYLQRRDDASGALHVIRGRAFSLLGGYNLFVGRDTQVRDNFRSTMVDALAWALAPVLLLGLVGGAIIGRYSLRRVDAVRATSADIVNGDLSRRVPLTGSGDEFDRLAQTINIMLDQIDSLMTGMRAVTDSLAHDLRSPLTHTKSIIEQALRHESDPEAYRRALTQTEAELETILRTFDALISIAQAEAGSRQLMLDRIDLSGLVNDLAELYQPIAENAGLDLAIAISPTVAIDGHRQLLARTIANLLDNAIKFTPAGGRVTVSLEPDVDSMRLTVCDTGPGIPPDDRERVLERFVRLDDSQNIPGSGLGLSLVAAVAKLHGARLSLEDNEPGLRISLAFPAP